jgi:hypothetical protein
VSKALFLFLGLWRSKNFLLVFWHPTSIRDDVVDLLVCIVEAHCAISTLIVLGGSLSYLGSKKHRTEASIRVPRMFNHTHSNNMINR